VRKIHLDSYFNAYDAHGGHPRGEKPAESEDRQSRADARRAPVAAGAEHGAQAAFELRHGSHR
jgi:hypothetical protein